MTRALTYFAMAACALLALPLVACGTALVAFACFAFGSVVAMDERGHA